MASWPVAKRIASLKRSQIDNRGDQSVGITLDIQSKEGRTQTTSAGTQLRDFEFCLATSLDKHLPGKGEYMLSSWEPRRRRGWKCVEGVGKGGYTTRGKRSKLIYDALLYLHAHGDTHT